MFQATCDQLRKEVSNFSIFGFSHGRSNFLKKKVNLNVFCELFKLPESFKHLGISSRCQGFFGNLPMFQASSLGTGQM